MRIRMRVVHTADRLGACDAEEGRRAHRISRTGAYVSLALIAGSRTRGAVAARATPLPTAADLHQSRMAIRAMPAARSGSFRVGAAATKTTANRMADVLSGDLPSLLCNHQPRRTR